MVTAHASVNPTVVTVNPMVMPIISQNHHAILLPHKFVDFVHQLIKIQWVLHIN